MPAPRWLTNRWLQQAVLYLALTLGATGGILAVGCWLRRIGRGYDELLAAAFQDSALVDSEP